MNIIGEYIKYLFNSKGKHKIHSPFVFDFVSVCLNIELDEITKMNSILQSQILQSSSERIHVIDVGQGSKKLNSSRKISEIYQSASSKGVYADLLYQLVKHYSKTEVLELGTSLGVGTFFLASGNKNGHVTTIDASAETQNIAKDQLIKLGLTNITFVNSTFKEYFDKKPAEVFDMIFIDGHHNGQALINYLQLLENNMHDETIIVLDDIRWSNDMFDAWKTLVLDQQYHLTLDLFRMGIIMKRQHQAKEHFIIKIKGILKGMM